MKRYFSILILTGILVFGLLTVSSADTIIYTNGSSNPDDMDSGALSDFDSLIFPSGEEFYQRGDDFILQPGATTITDVHWWGRYSYATVPGDRIADDDFTIRIFEMNGEDPDTIPYKELTNLDVQRSEITNLLTIYAYMVDVEPITLLPGMKYLLSIVNNTQDDPDGWVWALSSEGNFFTRHIDGEVWTVDDLSGSLAFQLTGIIPEPSTLLLLGLGLAGFGILRRRFKN